MKTVEIISIPVTDQQRAKAFYLQLGFEIVVETPFGENQWIQMRLPGNEVSFTLVNWFEKMPAGTIQGLVIHTPDLQKEIDELTAHGISVGKIDQTPWGKFAPVKDPDGNTLSLHQK